MNKKFFGGIEAGGTKFVCAIGDDAGHIFEQVRIPTETPEKTLEQVISFFEPFVLSKNLKTIGMGCFGPVDTDVHSLTYGYITSTPKPNWQNTNILGMLKSHINANVVLDTDVNTAALGEYTWGVSQNVDPSLYLTIGTGIGGGYIKDGKPLVGLVNPEMGHIRIFHNLENDPFPGICPYHGDCFEGLASGSALNKRIDLPAETIEDNHPIWELEANYIGQAIANFILVLSPKIIILGGGVMHKSFLFNKIRYQVQEILNRYVQHADIIENIDKYIVPPLLGNNAGVLGAIALAKSR